MAKRQAPRPAPTPAPAAAEYTVVARRYRPQQFAELVGQEPVARALANALKGGRVAHAYLFTGARGVGKTSTARILAKALNCVHGPTPTPCDVCEVCKSIASGEDIDVLEIDGASNRGIDEVRAIRQNVQTRPGRARYKVYIIDEVHMLTGPAFNALLKTLEEPPAHVKFIFATTEVQKIPITILSRCQRFDFAGIGTQRIAARLKEVVTAEGRQADDAALHLVARRAGGSMRDAQSLLDQLLAFGSERLTTDQVHALLGTAPDDRVMQLAGAVLARDAKAALALLAAFAEAGLQLGELLDQLIEYWRNLMLAGCAGAEVTGLDLPEPVAQTVAKQAADVPLDTILAGLDILAATKARFRASGHGLVLIEMAIVRLCRLADLVPAGQIAQWLAQSGTSSAPSPALPAPGTGTRSVEPPEAAKKKPLGAPELVATATSNGNGHTFARTDDPEPTTETVAPPFEQIWKQVLEKLGPMLAGQVVKAGLPAISGPKSLVLRFPPRYSGAYDYCKEPDRVSILERELKDCSGHDWLVRVEVGTETSAPSPEPPPASMGPGPTARQREREVLQHPLLSRVVETLGGRLMRMEEGFGANAADGGDQADIREG